MNKKIKLEIRSKLDIENIRYQIENLIIDESILISKKYDLDDIEIDYDELSREIMNNEIIISILKRKMRDEKWIKWNILKIK